MNFFCIQNRLYFTYYFHQIWHFNIFYQIIGKQRSRRICASLFRWHMSRARFVYSKRMSLLWDVATCNSNAIIRNRKQNILKENFTENRFKEEKTSSSLAWRFHEEFTSLKAILASGFDRRSFMQTTFIKEFIAWSLREIQKWLAPFNRKNSTGNENRTAHRHAITNFNVQRMFAFFFFSNHK